MLRRLKAKGYGDSVAEAAIRSLEEQGLQSDARFVDALVRSRAARGYGVLRIRHELHMRGVGDPDLEGPLRQYDWDALLAAVYSKKYGSGVPESAEEYAARLRFLSQRGFSQSQIQALFRRLRQNHE